MIRRDALTHLVGGFLLGLGLRPLPLLWWRRSREVKAAPVSLNRLVALHNEARETPLDTHPKLMKYASEWASEMAKSTRMRHSSMRDISALGFSTVGENIAVGQKDEAAVMRAWLSSPGHRRNIKSGSYTHIGVGAAMPVDSDRIYWCAVFGKPKDEEQ
jgi:uncharacterized protein YkwD